MDIDRNNYDIVHRQTHSYGILPLVIPLFEQFEFCQNIYT